MLSTQPWKIAKWRSSVARVHADALKQFPDDFSDPESTHIVPNQCEPYELIKKIGHGKFGEVFEGIDVRNGRMCAIKVLRPIRKKKLQREVKILSCLDQGPNIVTLFDIVRDPESKMFGFIFEEVDNDDFRELYPKLQLHEIKYYFYQILKSLGYAHSRGIMHRDIKPHNIMIDHSQHKLRVIDWGLAEFYRPGTEYNVRVASRHYKGPELLTNLRCYDYSLDIWSLGCVLAAIIFKRMPFFRGKDDDDQLVKITQVKYELVVPQPETLQNYPQRSWDSFIPEASAELCTPEVIDLIDRMLRRRLTRQYQPALEVEQKGAENEHAKHDFTVEMDYLDWFEYTQRTTREIPLSELVKQFGVDEESDEDGNGLHDRVTHDTDTMTFFAVTLEPNSKSSINLPTGTTFEITQVAYQTIPVNDTASVLQYQDDDKSPAQVLCILSKQHPHHRLSFQFKPSDPSGGFGVSGQHAVTISGNLLIPYEFARLRNLSENQESESENLDSDESSELSESDEDSESRIAEVADLHADLFKQPTKPNPFSVPPKNPFSGPASKPFSQPIVEEAEDSSEEGSFAGSGSEEDSSSQLGDSSMDEEDSDEDSDLEDESEMESSEESKPTPPTTHTRTSVKREYSTPQQAEKKVTHTPQTAKTSIEAKAKIETPKQTPKKETLKKETPKKETPKKEAPIETKQAPIAKVEKKPETPKAEKKTTNNTVGRVVKGCRIVDKVVGRGRVAMSGRPVKITYTGRLRGPTGRVFDKTKDKSRPFTFRLSRGDVIPGFEIGVEGMRVGGVREVYIPSNLGYGPRGAPPDIPPNSDLYFEIELVQT
ncbi:putative Casein kinase II subunit alpha [Blattamonas nauphoetae]|uniref:peptidylprolyl isomerase n=1 Tax=Blattamonas nauphoetae TaxID=2049346 RepID=A0ABQ9YME7_9EUKA|nr:putative Casein kinase II subunit alpha [Blattamonas nauphoetae]